MEKFKLRKPFFVVNPKSYLYGEEIYKLAKKTDELCEKYDFDCLFTAQLIDLPKIIADCPHLVPCAQFMESLKPGRGMGHVLPEALAAAGVKATFLNHAENPMTVHELAATIARANEVGILTVVCADSVEEGKAIAPPRRHGLRAHEPHRHRPGRRRGLHARLHRGRQGRLP